MRLTSWRPVVITAVIGAALMIPRVALAQYGVAMGQGHVVALKSDGTVWTWGNNGSGQLGSGNTTSRATPAVVSSLSSIVAVAAGSDHSLALKSDGTVWAWGSNGSGRLGDGTSTQRTSPVQVSGLTSVVAIAAGNAHSFALKSDGTLWAWGYNGYGELGDGTTTSRSTPVQVTSLSTNVAAIAADGENSLALKTDGSVWGWGSNWTATVGDGTATQRNSPTQSGSLSGMVAVSTGLYQSYALDSSGTLRAWGTDQSGEFGNGSTIYQQTTPLTVSSVTGLVQLKGGNSHTVAIKTDGTVAAWGYNNIGQVGDGTTTQRLSPVSLSGPSSVVAVAVHANSAVAVSSDGRVWAWGENTYGQLGDGTNSNRRSPVQISNAGFDWKVATPRFSALGGTYNYSPSVMITSDTAGAAIHYTLDGAEPTESDSLVPSGQYMSITQSVTVKAKAWLSGMPASNTGAETYTLVVPTPTISVGSGTYSSVQSVTLSSSLSGTTIRYTTDGTTPTESSSAYSSALSIGSAMTLKAVAFKTGWTGSAVASATYAFNFGTLTTPTISPAAGQYGYGQSITISASSSATIRYTTNGSTPTSSSTEYTGPLTLTGSMTVNAKAFQTDWTTSANASAAYTVRVSAPVFSPGSGTYTAGQLITVTNDTPSAVIHYTTNGVDPTESDPVIASGSAVVAGNYTLKARAFKTSWTSSDVTSAAYTTTGSFANPAVAAAYSHSAILRPEGTVWTWGLNSSGELGDGTTTSRSLPGIVSGLTGVLAIAVGDAHTLAMRNNGEVWAWGRNTSGQLGDNTTTNRTSPTLISGLTNVVAIAAGADFSMALKSDGTVWAWGANGNGQVGDGTTTQRNQPTQVSGLTSVEAIAAGGSHALARKTNGTVWAWGANSSGQVGDATTTQRLTPVQNGISAGDAALLGTGNAHSFAISSGGALRAWGDNSSGQLGLGSTTVTSPTVVTGFSASLVDSGYSHTIATQSDGSVWTWGNNSSGELGDGSTTNRTAPGQIASLSSIVAVSAGKSHSLALASDGTLWAWGLNSNGQLGDGTTTQRLEPVKIADAGSWKVGSPTLSPGPGTYTSVTDVTVATVTTGATLRYTVNGVDPTDTDTAVPSNGIVSITQTTTLKTRAWKSGLAPSNITTGVYTLQVPTPVLSKASGTYFTDQSVTVTNTGSGVTMRYTTNGSTPTTSDPVITSGGTVDITATMVLKVKGWKSGWSDSAIASATYTMQVATPSFSPDGGSQTGTVAVTMSTTTSGASIYYTLDGAEPAPGTAYTAPVSVSTSTTVRAIASRTGWVSSATKIASFNIRQGAATAPTFSPAAGTYDGSVIVRIASVDSDAVIRFTTDGSDPTSRSPRYTEPLLVASTTTLKAKVFRYSFDPSTTASATYSLDASGAVATPVLQPADAEFPTTQSVTVTVATTGATLHYTTDGSDPTESSATVTSGGTIQVDRSLPLKVKGFKDGLTSSAVRRADYLITGVVSAGAFASYAIKSDGTLWAWGRNTYGQLGDGTTTSRSAPVQVSGLSDVVAVAGATGTTGHALAVKRDGSVWSWGYNSVGQLGLGDQTSRSTPTQISGLTNVVAVAAGFYHSLALKSDGTVWAWGANYYGSLGDGTTTQRLSPVQVSGLAGIRKIAASLESSFALQDDGSEAGHVWSWGHNDRGQLGDGTNTDRSTPVTVAGLPAIVNIGTAEKTVYAIAANHSVWAWGANDSGMVDGSLVHQSRPVAVPPLGTALSGAGGLDFSGVVTREGDLWVWGNNNPYGQLGDGTTTWRRYQDHVTGLGSVLAAAFGTQHSLAITIDGTVKTWGGNGDGQLGDGTTTTRMLPVSVSSLTLVDNSWLLSDPDGDGLPTWAELRRGTDPLSNDTNGDGIPDSLTDPLHISSTSPDYDADGLSNAAEVALGTDPFNADTDGDGVIDSADAFPLDPSRSAWPGPVGGDTTPPVITLTEPTNATLVP